MKNEATIISSPLDASTLEPASRVFGFDRGTPIDRYYIERFLVAHAKDIRCRVLEIGDSTYTKRFGGSAVTQSDVLHAVVGNRDATLVGDLSAEQTLPADTFNCMILTQTLCCVYDLGSAVRNISRALRVGGVVLATVPGISQISRYDMERWGDYWRFTTLSARRIFEEIFRTEDVCVQAFGNVAVATSFLQGKCLEEMHPTELDYVDPDYEMLITIRARKTDDGR